MLSIAGVGEMFQTLTLRHHEAVRCFAQLGHESRMAIFRALAAAGEAGLTVGEIQEQLDIPASTLSHHLAALVDVKLVGQEREGRALRCRVEAATVTGLQRYLKDYCAAPSADKRGLASL
jgi:DNA-binding transcriptional ArsR family regulator